MNNKRLREIREKAINHCRLELYPIDDAIALVKECQMIDIPILGIDGFKLSHGTIQPFMEHSIDLSEDDDCHEKALSFLNAHREFDLVYEVVY